MTIQLTQALEQELGHLATERGLSADELAQRAIESFVLHERDLRDAIQRGDEDISAGRLLQHEEVVSRMDELLAAQ